MALMRPLCRPRPASGSVFAAALLPERSATISRPIESVVSFSTFAFSTTHVPGKMNANVGGQL
jgi:hypothetical protein